MDSQVKVTLTSLNGDVSPAQRTFVLNTNRRSISVGRASKSASKGLLGAEDNAWFDSPVMSRHHALMSFNPEDKAIMIEDIGSMHGTYLNDVQLSSKNVTAIGDNDEVKFGAEVRRGPETFPACRFRVNYEVVPYKPANSYEFPEYSDIDDEEEEEEELEFSDEADAREQISSDDGVSIESPILSAAKVNNPIDLTRDDSPVRSNLIDLTDETPNETPAEIALLSIISGRPTDINESASYSNIAVYAGNPMTVCEDSEEEDAHFSSDSDDQLEDDDSSSSESSSEEYGLDEVLDEILDEDVDDQVGESDDEYPDDYPMEDDEDDANLPSGAVMKAIHRFANATNDYTVVRLSEPFPAEESSADEEDNESDFGLSEAGEEGLRVLCEGGLLETLPEQISLPTVPAASLSELVPKVDMIHPFSKSSAAHHVMQSPVDQSSGLSYVSFRQPSPSDAAMVKSQISTTSAPLSTTAQSLGSVSGKSAFFAAREVNKQKFLSEEAKKPAVAFSIPSDTSNFVDDAECSYDTANLTRLGDRAARNLEQIGGKKRRSAFELGSSVNFRASQSTALAFVDSGKSIGQINPGERLTTSAMPRRGECAFLDMPDTAQITYRAASPIPDMTSAVTYSAGKEILAAKPLPKASVLKIQDLCSDPLPLRETLKRKAEDIASDSGEELRSWGNGSSYAFQNIPTPTIPTILESPTDAKIDGPRPTKRFRKFLERAGYVAIGGVAVGSALFTALIATAPDFA